MTKRPRLMETYGGKSLVRLTLEGRTGAFAAAAGARLRRDRSIRRFVIFAQGRTGSTLLTSSLDSHPDIGCADEILDRPRGDPIAYVENRARLCPADAFGFHVKCYQLSRIHGIDDWAGFLRTLSENGWQIIYLWRQNVVRHVFSGFFAQAAGRYHFRSAERRPEQIRIEPERFLSWLEQRQDLLARERAALAALPFHELAYESDLADIADREQALFGVQRMLEVDPLPLSSPLRRSVDRPLRAMIENYDELAEALAGTRWETQLDR